MREIKADEISNTVARLFCEANFYLTEDVLTALKEAAGVEESAVGKEVLDQIIRNADIAATEQIPLCQDCGAAVVFAELGQEVHISGGDFNTAINEGVRQAYDKGYLRKSMVNQPFSSRVNTRDNTPALIYTEIVPGDRLKITVVPKGGGAENMSRLGMLTPADGRKGIVDLVIKAVDEAGSNPCPPLIVGVGIGGTAERTLLLAKKALLRKVGEHNPDPEVAELEVELLKKINDLGIGPMGYGGRVTALAVNVEVFPAHIASMPVAINLNCHSSRHKEAVI
ncbi:MAG: fumarate hydratase [Dehalococcoidales bacterium]|nr:fumarate hydratase [Dehalococcoidales bacterium]